MFFFTFPFSSFSHSLSSFLRSLSLSSFSHSLSVSSSLRSLSLSSFSHSLSLSSSLRSLSLSSFLRSLSLSSSLRSLSLSSFLRSLSLSLLLCVTFLSLLSYVPLTFPSLFSRSSFSLFFLTFPFSLSLLSNVVTTKLTKA
jgi:hypothetical protein